MISPIFVAFIENMNFNNLEIFKVIYKSFFVEEVP